MTKRVSTTSEGRRVSSEVLSDTCTRVFFGGGPKLGCSDSVRAGFIETHNFFCLRPYPGEIAHSNSANRELSNDLSDLVVRRRKVALHTI